MSEKNLENLINKRILIYAIYKYKLDEYKVLEVSPSKTYIKLEGLNKNITWRHIDFIEIVEILEENKEFILKKDEIVLTGSSLDEFLTS